MNVLLGVDGTDSSLRALDRATERTVETGDELTVAIAADAEPAIENRVETACDQAGIDATTRRIEGDFGSGLVDLADAEGFDRLVVGGGDRSPMGKIDLPHDTQFVLLNAPITVTLVR